MHMRDSSRLVLGLDVHALTHGSQKLHVAWVRLELLFSFLPSESTYSSVQCTQYMITTEPEFLTRL
jgi:hypothetical protein